MMGGLGNQMFQYAFAYLLAKDFKDCIINFDVRSYKRYYWPFDIINFKIPKNYEIIKSGKLKYDCALKFYHVYQRIYEIINNCRPNFISERNLKKNNIFCGTFCEKPNISKNINNLFLYGYFQNAELFESIRGELCDMYTIKTISDTAKNYIKEIKNNSALVSIRFLSKAEQKHAKKENTLPDESFYKKSIQELLKRNISQILFASNDVNKIKEMSWIKSIPIETIFIENCSATEQIEIMKRCRYFVISNSTFSWWGAYLGSYINNGLVIAPPIWAKNKVTRKTKIVFKEMLILD